MERIAKYEIEAVIPYVVRKSKSEIKQLKKETKNDIYGERDYDGHSVKMYSQRYQLFLAKGLVCVGCGLTGEYFALEKHKDAARYHFNLYGVNKKGKEVLITKDHIISKLDGGKDQLTNYQVMCTRCNGKKGEELNKKKQMIDNLKDKMEDWEKEVYKFAKDAHSDQKDDSGENYFEAHILQVVKILKKVTTDEEMIQAAYLHDTIEDTHVYYEQLKDVFGERVANLVNELTHEGEEDKGYYFPRLTTKDGIVLKFCDRLSNLSRMMPWDEERQNHYLKKSKFWYSEPKDNSESKEIVIKVAKKDVEELLKKGKDLNKSAIELRSELKKIFKK